MRTIPLPDVSEAVDPQLKATLYGKLTDFLRAPETTENPIEDAVIVSRKVQSNGCFGAFVKGGLSVLAIGAAVLAIGAAVLAVFGGGSVKLGRMS